MRFSQLRQQKRSLTFSALTKGALGWIYLLVLLPILMNIIIAVISMCSYCLFLLIILFILLCFTENDFTLHQVFKQAYKTRVSHNCCKKKLLFKRE